jgi:HD-GYP domain-containing protein (c-di-GMP phosphodiesterase class II)
MFRSIIVCVSTLLALSACRSTVETQDAKIEETRKEEELKIRNAADEAKTKTESAQKEANEKVNDINLQKQADAEKARLDANQNARTDNEDALKKRAEFEVEMNRVLNKIDGDLDRIRSKVNTTEKSKRVKIEAMMPKVDLQHSVVVANLASLPRQTAKALPEFKVKTERDMSDLRASVAEVAAIL